MKVNYFGCTDTGRMRENNEDAFLAQNLPKQDWLLGCVIDGVGGYSGGEVAAELAKKSIGEIFSKEVKDVPASMKAAFSNANAAILEEKQRSPQLEQMACVLTLVIADLAKNEFHYAHVGDTRLYLFRDQSLIKVSKDHSFVGFLEDTGRLSESAAMQHPKRNEINKALGFSAAMEAEDYIEIGASPFLPGDVLLLCSDGVTDMLSKQELTDLLNRKSSLEEKGKSIIDAANEKGGKDNSTVVLICNDKQALQQEATKPVLKKKDEEPSEVVAEKTETSELPVSAKKRSGAMLFLVVICIALLAALSWALWKIYKPSAVVLPVITDSVAQKDPLAVQLQQAIASGDGDTLVLSDSAYQAPILVSDTIVINRDNFYLKAKGLIKFIADSGYRGPAFYFASDKEVTFDSVSFENFSVALLVPNGNVQLKNVRFENCSAAVSKNYFFPGNVYVSGTTKSTVFRTDTIPETQK